MPVCLINIKFNTVTNMDQTYWHGLCFYVLMININKSLDTFIELI
jgi:hypothetical protein